MHRWLLAFFFITTLGSALSSIAAFLSITTYFQHLVYLGIALGAKTLASAIFSYFAPRFVKHSNLRASLIFSQIIGLVALFVLFFGFFLSSYPIALLGMILSGIPGTLVAIMLTVIFRISTDNTGHFRAYSSKRELLLGIALLAASIVAPLLLSTFELNIVFAIDAMSYIVGLILLKQISLPHQFEDDHSASHQILQQPMLYTPSVRSFLIKTSAAMLLAGLLPLLAASNQIQIIENIPVLFRQWLWSIEDITAISASIIYLVLIYVRKRIWFEWILMLNGIWILFPMFYPHYLVLVCSLAIICISIDYAFQQYRDDLILSAGKNFDLVKQYSACAQLQKNLIMCISPILLSLFMTYSDIETTFAIIMIFQVALVGVYSIQHRVFSTSHG